MTTHRKIAQALRLGAGAALLASAAFMSGSANAQTALCSASGSGGRQNATVSISPRDPSICVRVKLGTPAAPGLPDCWVTVQTSGFTCSTIVDLN
jgi:hypothetical protein